MKCENCGKNEVSFVYHSSINGRVEEKNLCQHCAQELGYARKLQESYAGMHSMFQRGFSPLSLFSDFTSDPFERFFGGSFLGSSLLDDFFALPGAASRAVTEAPAEEKKQEALLGEEEQKALSRQRELNALRAEMKQAVESENFERAAELRDQLRAKEKES